MLSLQSDTEATEVIDAVFTLQQLSFIAFLLMKIHNKFWNIYLLKSSLYICVEIICFIT